MNNREKRISHDTYVRPKKTYQDKLSAEEIKEKLEDYIQVNKITDIPIDTHVRYFSIVKSGKKTKKIFRMGGFLKRKDNTNKYVILTNGRTSWSVQTESTIFFRKMNINEIKGQYEDEIDEMEAIIKKQKTEIRKLKSTIRDLKKKPKK